MLYEIFYPLTRHFIGFNLFRYISFRAIFAAITAFLVCVVVGPGIIRLLRKKRFGERIASASKKMNDLNADKAATPTMGGLIILLAIVVSVVLFGRLGNLYVLLGLWTVTAFALIGAADDWTKLKELRRREREPVPEGGEAGRVEGMSTLTKLYLQLFAGALAVLVLWLHVRGSPELTSIQLPFVKEWTFDLGPLYLLLALVVIVGASNGVNFTDGMDGLAIGGVTMTGLTFVVVTYLVGRVDMTRFLHVIYVPGAGELTVFLGAVVGAGLGFLWFNCFPAQVFMGDTGSLALGAALGYVAVCARQEILLMVAGLMFAVDGLSVAIQIAGFRLTGRKPLPFAPLSNLFRIRGQHEVKVTVRYWIVAALTGALALVLLKVR